MDCDLFLFLLALTRLSGCLSFPEVTSAVSAVAFPQRFGLSFPRLMQGDLLSWSAQWGLRLYVWAACPVIVPGRQGSWGHKGRITDGLSSSSLPEPLPCLEYRRLSLLAVSSPSRARRVRHRGAQSRQMRDSRDSCGEGPCPGAWESPGGLSGGDSLEAGL